MKRSEKKNVNPNELTITIKGAMPLSSGPEETACWNGLRQGIKCRGFALFCIIDKPDPGEPGFTLLHKVDLAEVAEAILQNDMFGAAAVYLAKNGMLLTGEPEGGGADGEN